jgi:hypothetical protein
MAVDNTRAIYKNVKVAAEKLKALVKRAVILFLEGKISLNGFAIKLPCRFVYSIGGTDNYYVASFLAKRLRHAIAETASAACHDRPFALNIKHIAHRKIPLSAFFLILSNLKSNVNWQNNK